MNAEIKDKKPEKNKLKTEYVFSYSPNFFHKRLSSWPPLGGGDAPHRWLPAAIKRREAFCTFMFSHRKVQDNNSPKDRCYGRASQHSRFLGQTAASKSFGASIFWSLRYMRRIPTSDFQNKVHATARTEVFTHNHHSYYQLHLLCNMIYSMAMAKALLNICLNCLIMNKTS